MEKLFFFLTPQMEQIVIFNTSDSDPLKSVLHHFSREPDHNPYTPHTNTHTLPSTIPTPTTSPTLLYPLTAPHERATARKPRR